MIVQRHFKALLVILLFLIASPLLTSLALGGNEHEKTAGIKEDDYDLKQRRQQWIDDMHRAEPGIDWRVIDQEIRMSKYEIKKEKIKAMLKMGKNPKDQPLGESVAQGRLKGSWLERGSNNQAGRIHTADIDFDRNLIYAASAGGNVWRGTIDGKNWTCLNNGIQFPDIKRIRVFKIGSINRIVVATNSPSAVYYSDDEGMIWNKASGLESVTSWGYIQKAVVANEESNSIYLLVGEWDSQQWKSINSIYISTDKGLSFTRIKRYDNGLSRSDIWSPRYGKPVLYLINNKELTKISPDGTVEWSNEINELDQFAGDYRQLLLSGCYEGNQLHLVLAVVRTSSRRTDFFKSTDAGLTWTNRGYVEETPFMNNSFSLATYSSDAVYYGGVEFYKSFDGGKSWDKQNYWGDYYGKPQTLLHADIPSIDAFHSPAGEEIILISTDGGLYKSVDEMLSVRNLSLIDLNVSQYYSVLTNKRTLKAVFAGSQDQGFQRCISDSGTTLGFEQTISGDYGQLVTGDSGNTIWSVYPGFVLLYKQASEQKNYEFRFDFQGSSSDRVWLPPMAVDITNPNICYLASSGTNGTSVIWRLFYASFMINGEELPYDFKTEAADIKPTSIAVSPFTSKTLYVLSSRGDFYVSTNSGNSWIKSPEFGGPNDHYLYGNCVLPSKKQNGKIYIAGSGYSNPGAWVTYDNGVSFIPIDSGLPKSTVFQIAMTDDEKYLFAATQVGPYVYSVAENRWFDMSGIDSPDQTFWSVEYLDAIKTVRFATYGRGIWDFKISEFTDIEETKLPAAGADKPQVRAYPNPVTGRTTIMLDLKAEQSGSVKIYDNTGRLITLLYEGMLRQGSNSFEWDITGTSTKLPQGNYFCIVATGGECFYTKIIVE